jgi:hypothetical protein
MAAPTTAACVKKTLANPEPSTHGPSRRFHNSAHVRCWSNRTSPPSPLSPTRRARVRPPPEVGDLTEPPPARAAGDRAATRPRPPPAGNHQGSEDKGPSGPRRPYSAAITREGRPAAPAATTPRRHPILKITVGAAGPGRVGGRRAPSASSEGRRARGSPRHDRPRNKRPDTKKGAKSVIRRAHR